MYDGITKNLSVFLNIPKCVLKKYISGVIIHTSFVVIVFFFNYLWYAGEADLVSHHINKLIDSGLQADDIAVIAPYNLQVRAAHLIR